MENTVYNLKQPQKAFSRIGFALSAIVAVAFAAQFALAYIPRWIWGNDNWLDTTSWGFWIKSLVPMYVFAFPAGWLVMRKMPTHAPERHNLTFGKGILLFFIAQFIMYAGNIIGNLSAMILSGGKAQNAIAEYAMDTNPLKILVMVILAPLFEEFVFRKLLIDRTRAYGEKAAVFFSAITFGLLHQNFFQFFYAFGVGFAFAYIYVRTGKLRYTVIMHAVVNFMGAVIAPWIISQLDLNVLMSGAMTEAEMMKVYADILPGLMLYLLYAFFLLGSAVTGLVLFIVFFKRFMWKWTEWQLPKNTAFKTIYVNAGVILFVVICLIFMVISLF